MKLNADDSADPPSAGRRASFNGTGSSHESIKTAAVARQDAGNVDIVRKDLRNDIDGCDNVEYENKGRGHSPTGSAEILSEMNSSGIGGSAEQAQSSPMSGRRVSSSSRRSIVSEGRSLSSNRRSSRKSHQDKTTNEENKQSNSEHHGSDTDKAHSNTIQDAPVNDNLVDAERDLHHQETDVSRPSSVSRRPGSASSRRSKRSRGRRSIRSSRTSIVGSSVSITTTNSRRSRRSRRRSSVSSNRSSSSCGSSSYSSYSDSSSGSDSDSDTNSDASSSSYRSSGSSGVSDSNDGSSSDSSSDSGDSAQSSDDNDDDDDDDDGGGGESNAETEVDAQSLKKTEPSEALMSKATAPGKYKLYLDHLTDMNSDIKTFGRESARRARFMSAGNIDIDPGMLGDLSFKARPRRASAVCNIL